MSQSGVWPRLVRRGKICDAIATQIGAVVQLQTKTVLLTLAHRPTSLGGGFAKFLEVARSAPPGQAGPKRPPAAVTFPDRRNNKLDSCSWLGGKALPLLRQATYRSTGLVRVNSRRVSGS
jgi:hypothetical protein